MLIVPKQFAKFKSTPKVGDIVKFTKYKCQTVASKETLVLGGDIDILFDNSLLDESNPVIDFNLARA